MNIKQLKSDKQIGSQVWSAKNLDVTTYRNGDLIPEVQDNIAWVNLTTGAWCYYDNDASNGIKYGKLYNWYAVNDPRGLAPNGYHIPTDDEWTKLTQYLGGEDEAGKKMKSASGWDSNFNGTNSSGFSGLPGGKSINGSFHSIGNGCYFWSSSEDNEDFAWLRELVFIGDDFNRRSIYKGEGLSVRCLRDNYNGKLENLESEMHEHNAQIEVSSKDKAQNNIEKTTLSVEIYSRGKEVFGLNYHHSNFNKLKFLKKHNDDYYELSDDCLESEVPIENSSISIYLGDHKIFDEEYKDGLYEKVKVLDSNKSESYRKLLNSKKDEIAVIWFHDYVNTIKYVWENIKEFDPTKLVVISKYRIDETDNSKYEIVSHIVYDSKEADEIETEGSPKSGYVGPFVI